MIVGVLIFIVIILIAYILLLKGQFRSINRQLSRRLNKHTRQPVSVQMIDHQLNELVININNCLKAEETLRLAGIREEKKFRDLIANISHDLRTPLTAINGYLQMLDNTELNKEQQRKIIVARKYAGELEQLIARFFEYSYLITTEPQLVQERINLTNQVTEYLAEMVPAFEERQLKLQLEAAEPVVACGDKESIIRILQNLIRNCLQHAIGYISVSCYAEREYAVVAFRNPVDKDLEFESDKLFVRFYTGDKARERSTGLGLSIVKILVTQMKGTVHADTGKGWLEIQIKLPLYTADKTTSVR
jgi:signal transduction histidine kinase